MELSRLCNTGSGRERGGERGGCREIRLIESKAKCRHLKIYLERHIAAGDYRSKAPAFPSFCLGWSSNFVGSESGQI
jgi:hypothetical protein